VDNIDENPSRASDWRNPRFGSHELFHCIPALSTDVIMVQLKSLSSGPVASETELYNVNYRL
jgi:hypothetical protein